MTEKKFEDAMKRLEEIVQKLEDGELPLEESLKVFEEGIELVRACSSKLEEAEKKVTLLVEEGPDKTVQIPFEHENSL